jgi:hypothetical protein
MSAHITQQELRAVYVAWDEMVSYIEVIGQDSSLDDEEMPSPTLDDATSVLRALLVRNGLIDATSAA